LPYQTAAALARTVGESVTDGDLRTLSAGGYRDTTRLAASEVNMMLDIVLTNRTNVLAAVRALQAQLAEVERALAQADERGLAAYLEQARRSRRIT
jgi:prephenate dehydrogenase